MLTSHVDVLPTLLGLTGINADLIREKLSKDHTEALPLVGTKFDAIILRA